MLLFLFVVVILLLFLLVVSDVVTCLLVHLLSDCLSLSVLSVLL